MSNERKNEKHELIKIKDPVQTFHQLEIEYAKNEFKKEENQRKKEEAYQKHHEYLNNKQERKLNQDKWAENLTSLLDISLKYTQEENKIISDANLIVKQMSELVRNNQNNKDINRFMIKFFKSWLNDGTKEYLTNPHETLGIKKDATKEIIQKTYCKLALKYHPDKNNGGTQFTNAMFKKITQAYVQLK